MIDALDNHQESTPTAGVISYLDRPVGTQRDTSNRTVSHFEMVPDLEQTNLATANADFLTIGLLDNHPFSQECLIKAFNSLHPNLTVFAFATVQEYLAAARTDLDVIIYYSHGTETSADTVAQAVTTICQPFRSVPLIVLSDEEDARQLKTVRATLKNGARGFIPTRSTGLSMTFAAIRLVKAGGTFVPIDLLLANPSERPAAPENHLTSRQTTVLYHLRQGKANKIIAYELGMSESTVKIHIRNLMRKLGATNRTQVAYKAEQFLSGEQAGRMANV
jgi:DNA-binding NarL/FixJ family response regulator